jgi:hypothetical protein
MSDEQFELIRDLLAEILHRLERLEAHPPSHEPARADDLVDVSYVMRVTGLARVTILQGKAGTREIPLAGMRPRRWRKGDVDVDRFVRDRAARFGSPKRKALKLLERKRA